MFNIIDDITFVSKKHDRKISKALELIEKLGITYFAIQNVSYDGYWSIVSSNPTWIEYSAGNNFYHYDPSLINPVHYHSGASYFSSHNNIDFTNKMRFHAEEYFDMGHCLGIIEKTPKECWFTFYSTSVKNIQIINTYISKIKFLRHFSEYFRSENRHLFCEAKERCIDLNVLNPNYISGNNNIANVSPFEFVNNKNNILFNNLTMRQQQILINYFNGKTAKETGRILCLSHRTIEEHFEKLKLKMNCKYKRDLLSIFE